MLTGRDSLSHTHHDTTHTSREQSVVERSWRIRPPHHTLMSHGPALTAATVYTYAVGVWVEHTRQRRRAASKSMSAPHDGRGGEHAAGWRE